MNDSGVWFLVRAARKAIPGTCWLLGGGGGLGREDDAGFLPFPSHFTQSCQNG
jgi:hypothetical protein